MSSLQKNAGTLSWSNWNLKMLVFVEGTKPSTESEVFTGKLNFRPRPYLLTERLSEANTAMPRFETIKTDHSRFISVLLFGFLLAFLGPFSAHGHLRENDYCSSISESERAFYRLQTQVI